jgi:hypothetical protein
MYFVSLLVCIFFGSFAITLLHLSWLSFMLPIISLGTDLVCLFFSLWLFVFLAWQDVDCFGYRDAVMWLLSF